MFNDSPIDRCIEDLSSTLELAEALEKQLELVHKAVSQTGRQSEAAENLSS